MKKNLRIVSVAAAALLAVAPVAAAGVSSVSAADVPALDSNTQSTKGDVNWALNGQVVSGGANITPNLTLTTQNKFAGLNKSSLTGSITAKVDGQSYTAVYAPANATDAGTKVTVKDSKGTVVNSGADLVPGDTYEVTISSLKFNFGTPNANKKFTLTLAGGTFEYGTEGANPSHEVTTNSAGVVELKNVVVSVTAHDYADPATVQFVNRATGVPVSSGSVDMIANAQGEANVNTVAAAINAKYTAMQVRYENGTNGKDNGTGLVNQAVKEVATGNDVAAALKKENISVSPTGFFKAPHSFTVNVSAKSAINTASATMPVSVVFTNVADPVVPSQPKTIMHNAYFYDKNAKRVGTDKVTRYNTVTVSMNKTKFSNGIEYYEVVENNKLSGKFINADNIDGTKRTLKHNAYVYRSSKKRANKVVLKKGTEVVTYGGAYTFKNGKQYYKIGNNTDKTYVKASNF
ncbi:silent surface layer protein [Lactobacillus crispatus]|uniref:SLAP domain-containing protein n=1 Tax=Lactobacillus crispatus TaxID=47770 RepID=UPI0018E30697|nr:SLAP domain-containing protein [Lactobacillus crispatus]MBI1692895.1 silent surface layer protein [Lactobacillus crispatus]